MSQEAFAFATITLCFPNPALLIFSASDKCELHRLEMTSSVSTKILVMLERARFSSTATHPICFPKKKSTARLSTKAGPL
jgi:hypothetical protein